ncbi:MAG: hypothetical protein GX088_06605 [Clostridia bacterium]|nr:hypothetical protein [Clostridia bacterium]
MYRLKPQDLENSEKSLSLHRLEIGQIIKLGQQLYPDRIADEIIIIGVEAEDLTPFKTGLSKTLKKTVPQVIEVVLTEIDL